MTVGPDEAVVSRGRRKSGRGSCQSGNSGASDVLVVGTRNEAEGAAAMRSVGLDLGVRKIALCEVQDQTVICRATVDGIGGLQRWLGPGTPKARVVFEACRTAWHVHQQLCDWGHEPVMLDTTRSRGYGIGAHGRKNDRNDAEAIAMLAERGHYPQAHVLSIARQRLRHLTLARRSLVETRANLATTIRGICTAEGLALPSCEPERLASVLETYELPEPVQYAVHPLQQALAATEQQLCTLDERLVAAVHQDGAIVRLMTVPGVGQVCAASFVSVIDDAGRFRNAHQVAAYLGLVPAQDSSGDRNRLGHITKQGNKYVRTLLVESAHVILNLPTLALDPLRIWAKSLQERRGRKVAAVALARRLAGVLWAIWRDASSYAPHLAAQASSRGVRISAHQRHALADQLHPAHQKLARVASALRTRRARVQPTPTSNPRPVPMSSGQS
jgi:transposase